MDLDRIAIVALGSNVGNPRQNVLDAMQRLEALSASQMLRSSLWQTSPLDCPPGSPPFINAVVAMVPSPDETPETLLHKLKLLEQEFGRRPKQVQNEPRPLDLDLIVFGRQTSVSEVLTLPHPRAHQRRFVLQPLCEIAPDLVFPGQTRTVRQLLENTEPDAGIRSIE